MVHIQDLPIELLRLILSFIADPADEPFLKLPDRPDQSAKAKGGNANDWRETTNMTMMMLMSMKIHAMSAWFRGGSVS